MPQRLLDLGKNPDFLAFQNELTRSLYAQLRQGYESEESEVDLLKRMATTAKSHSWGPINVHADKIHGKRSCVEFKFRDESVTKELGDLALIGVITQGKKRLFSRITFVQNKKAQCRDRWSIDQKQLFLLKNFPALSGNNNLFPSSGNRQFQNHSNCLGSFGLFHKPGEMIFLSASHVAELQKGKKSLAMSDISVLPFGNGHNGISQSLEFLHVSFSDFESALVYFGNVLFSRDLSELVRHWTQFRVGEPTFAFDRVLNPHVDDLLCRLMQQAGLNNLFDAKDTQTEYAGESESDFVVMVVHSDIEKKADESGSQTAV